MGYVDLPYSDKNNLYSRKISLKFSFLLSYLLYLIGLKLHLALQKNDAMKQSPTSFSCLIMFNFLKTINIYLVETMNEFP